MKGSVRGFLLIGLVLALARPVAAADDPDTNVPFAPIQAAAPKKPPENFFVRVDELPVQIGGKFPGRILHRGEPVQVTDGENENFVAIQFGAVKNPLTTRVPFWTLSRTKPLPAKSQLPKSQTDKKEASDLDRMRGTWGEVACSVLGHFNPKDADGIDIHDVDIPGTAKNTIDPASLFPHSFGECCRFADQRLTTWYVLPSLDENGKMLDGPHDRATWELRIDPQQHPKRLDVVFRINGDIISIAPGIYEFHGEYLKWALAPQVLLKGEPGASPYDVERHRPRGFDDKQSKQSITVWLSRLDEREFPSPAANAPALGMADGTDAPLTTQYVRVNTLPVDTGGKFPGHLLHRGDAVQMNDNYDENILFKANGKWIGGSVLSNALSPSMPSALPPRPTDLGAKNKAPSDSQRLRGTWQLVSWSVLGHLNPGFEELGTMRVTVPAFGNGNETRRISPLQAVLPENYFRFTAGAAVTWSILPVVDAKDSTKVHSEPYQVNRCELRLDSAAKPKCLDLIETRGANFTFTTPGIYEFEGDLLKWAQACQMPHGMDDPANPPDRLRPKDFDTKKSDRFLVLWLSRVNEHDVPAFPDASSEKAPRPNRRPAAKDNPMDAAKRKALQAAGWKIGDAADFLEMSDGERQLLDARSVSPSATVCSPEAARVNDQSLIHFEKQWKLFRSLTRDLLRLLSDDELQTSPGANLGHWWKQFRHVGRVQENYINALTAGTMKFGFEGTSYEGDSSNRSLDAYLRRLDLRLKSLIEEGLPTEIVDWFGEPKSVGEHLMCLADHELLHHGQWIVYRRLLGGPFPKSWRLWGV